MSSLPHPTIALITLCLIVFAISLFLHKRILEQMKTRHFELWARLGSPKPIEAMNRNMSPGPRQASGAMSYTGWRASLSI